MKNAVLLSNVDREDLWVTGGLVFRVKNTNTYAETYAEIKDRLESPALVDQIVNDRCLFDDLFDRDETYKFVGTECSGGVFFVFENSEGDRVKYRFSMDYVTVFE